MLQYEVLTGDAARRGEELSALCRVAFDDFDPRCLTDRLPLRR